LVFHSKANNDKTEEQTLLVTGDVAPSNKSITLTIQKTEEEKFKLSLKHYPTNVTVNNHLFESNTWYV
jgi:hypothetical protein